MVTTMTQSKFFYMWIYTAVLFFIAAGLSAWAWGQIPDDQLLPTHWGISGEPDDFGSKTEALLIMPAFLVGISLLLGFIPRFEPRRLNLERSAKAYQGTWAGIITFFLVLHVAMVLSALGYNINMAQVAPFFIGVLFAVLGNYMSKVRSNFFYGIRTPWTLTSELSWNKTHRLGSKLFVFAGLVMMVSSFWPAYSFYALFGVLMPLLIVLFAYSYWVWKSDPEARPTSSLSNENK